MYSGAITSNIDVAQVTLYMFWVFFAGLVYYLHRENKREGYPLESEGVGGTTKVQGWPPVPAPKTYLLRDGRMFGRQAYAGLTTPFGEVRLGRQYAPIFFSSALVTTERFGGTDQFIEGGLSNSLNIRWDNAITYSAQVGGFRGQLGFSPNAGVADRINFQRGANGSDTNGNTIGGRVLRR